MTTAGTGGGSTPPDAGELSEPGGEPPPDAEQSAPLPVARRVRVDDVVRWLAAVVCLLFAANLRDLSTAALRGPPLVPAIPASAGARDAVLRVDVVDREGQVVADAPVRVFCVIDDVPHLAGEGRTDGQGTIIFPRLVRGEAWVVARSDSHARATSRLVLAAGERAVQVKLRPAHFFEVVTIDQQRQPVAGVHVWLYGADPLAHAALTDARGLARLTHLGPPPYAVEVQAPGFDGKFLPRVGLEDSPLFIKLERLGALEVTVLEPEPVETDPADAGAQDAGVPAIDEPEPALRPAVGAMVTVAGSALWPGRTAETDARGRVRIAGLRRGFYDLKAEKGELVSEPAPGVLLDRGETETIELILEPGRRVTVRVTDGEEEDSPGIANADVALVEGGISSFPLYGRTDETGAVVLGPMVGDATVSARAAGYVARSAVPVEEDQTEVQVPLLRGGTLVGQVVDERDYPIAGASLEVVGVDPDGMPIDESSSITGFREDHFAFALPGATPLIPAGELGVMPVIPDIPPERGELVVRRLHHTSEPWVSGRDGTFDLQPVPPGRLRVVVRHPEYVEAISHSVELVPGGRAELRIVLRRGGALEGRVLEANRTPVAGARLEVAALEGSLERITYTADDGTFAFAALPERILVSVARGDAPQNIVLRAEVTVPPEERKEIEIVLPERRGDVEFRVVDDRGYPLDRVELRVFSLEPSEPLRLTLFTDDSGEATMRDGRGLPLRIVLGRSDKAPRAVELERASRRVELVMGEAVTARGRVRSGRNERLAGAKVTLFTPTGTRFARTGEEGEFTFRGLAPVPVRVLVTKDGYAPLEDHRTIAPDAQHRAELGTFELELGGSIAGEVLDADEQPLAGVRVAIGRVPTYLPLGQLPLGVASTNRRGRFVLRDVAPGRVTVEAYRVGVGRSEPVWVVVRGGEDVTGLSIAMLEDQEEEPDALRGAGSLAVTLGERFVGGERQIVFEHVPLDGEAERAGIEPGDELVAINGVEIDSIREARRKMTGPLTEEFVMTLRREPDLRWSILVRRERLRR